MFIWKAKAAQNPRYRWVMVPGIGCTSKCFLDTLEVIEELKAPVIAGAWRGRTFYYYHAPYPG